MSLAPQPVLTGPTGSLLDLIGKTPMVEVTRMDTGKCRLFLKLESQNPGGSIKDRIALSMIAAAEAEGFLKPGGGMIVNAAQPGEGERIDATGLARQQGALVVANLVLLGFAVRQGGLFCDASTVESVLKRISPERQLETNLAGFRLGLA